MKVRIPKPFMKFASFSSFTAYAWCCNHKTLGLQSLENTSEEAKKAFKEIVKFELNRTDIIFIE